MPVSTTGAMRQRRSPSVSASHPTRVRLAEFAGAGRRLESHGEVGGVAVLDDYAHHPAEIAATIEAVHNGSRVLVLFQPHLYSRTRHLVRSLRRRCPRPTWLPSPRSMARESPTRT